MNFQKFNDHLELSGALHKKPLETDIIDKLFLELSQVTKATTGKELKLQAAILKAEAMALGLCYQIEKCAPSMSVTEASIIASKLRQFLEESSQ